MGRIELPTPSLPRKCSTAELHRLLSFRAEDGARTRHLKLGRLSLCQMSYFRLTRGGGWTRTTELIRGQIYSLLQLPLCDSPEFVQPRAGRRTRTADRLITNQLLYQLSYTGTLSKNTRPLQEAHPLCPKGCAKLHTFSIPTTFFFLFFSKKW